LNSRSFELGIRPLRVVATHREGTKPSDRETEFENRIEDCWVRVVDGINGIYRI
jgi:hypothetical protein